MLLYCWINHRSFHRSLNQFQWTIVEFNCYNVSIELFISIEGWNTWNNEATRKSANLCTCQITHTPWTISVFFIFPHDTQLCKVKDRQHFWLFLLELKTYQNDCDNYVVLETIKYNNVHVLPVYMITVCILVTMVISTV